MINLLFPETYDVAKMPWYRRIILPWVLLSIIAGAYFFNSTFSEYKKYKQKILQNQLRLEELNEQIYIHWNKILEKLNFLSSKSAELGIELDNKIINTYKNSPPYNNTELISAARTLTILEVKNAFSSSSIEHIKCLTDESDPCKYWERQINRFIKESENSDKDDETKSIILILKLLGLIEENEKGDAKTIKKELIAIFIESQKDYLHELINSAIRDIVNDPTVQKKLKYISNESSFKLPLSDLSMLSTAYAQKNIDMQKGTALDMQFRWYIYAALGLAWFLCIFKILFSKNNANIDVATDLLKTLTGFFIGVGTSMS